MAKGTVKSRLVNEAEARAKYANVVLFSSAEGLRLHILPIHRHRAEALRRQPNPSPVHNTDVRLGAFGVGAEPRSSRS